MRVFIYIKGQGWHSVVSSAREVGEQARGSSLTLSQICQPKPFAMTSIALSVGFERRIRLPALQAAQGGQMPHRSPNSTWLNPDFRRMSFTQIMPVCSKSHAEWRSRMK
jgi:hypothetical protein